MLATQFTKLRRSFYIEVFGNKDWTYFWEARFLPRWVPLLFGIILGVAAAALIHKQDWHYLLPLVSIVPAAILFNRYPFTAIITWFLLTQFFISTVSPTQRMLFWVLYRAMPPLTLGLVLLASWLKISKKKTIQLGRADLAILIFLLIAVINSFMLSEGSMRRELIKFYDRLLMPCVMYWLVRLIAPEERDLKRFVPVLFIAVIVQSTVGLLQWFSPDVLPLQWVGSEGERTTGTLEKAAVYTTLLLLGSVFMFQYVLVAKSYWVRFILLLAFGLALACVFFSFSRGSWLGGVIVLVGMMSLYPRKIIPLVLIVLVIMVILGGSILAAQMNHAWDRLNNEDTANSRIVQDQAAIRMIQLKPIFGWGWGNYDRYDYQFFDRVGDNIAVTHDDRLHNTYLFIITELGFVGFIAFLLPLIWWFWLSIKIWHRLPRTGFENRYFVALLWLVLLNTAIVSTFMPMIYEHYYGATLFWFCLALIGNTIEKHLQPGDIGVSQWSN